MQLSNLRKYAYLMRTFRNGAALVQSYRTGRPCEEAVLMDGTRLVHPPGRGGLVGTLLELWYERCYAPDGFYRPSPGDVVLDAGAHVGLFAIWLARECPACRVVALEPMAENHDCLLKNLAAAGATRVEPHRIALGPAAGWGRMESCTDRSIDHRLLGAESGDTGDPPGADTVPADAVRSVSVGELVELSEADEIALLKADVEGAEYDAFADTPRHVWRRIAHIALEYHDHLRPGTLSLLRECLTPTHRLTVVPTEDRGYGVLYASRR